MSKARFLGVMAVALCAVMAAGVLVASNMGFKLNYQLIGPNQPVPGQETNGDGLAVDGTNTLALPFNRQVGIDLASQLYTDIGADSVQLFSRDSNSGLAAYTGGGKGSGDDFNLTAGVAVNVKIPASQSYIVVGSHDPSLSLTLIGPNQAVPGQETNGDGLSVDGTNFYAHAYHSTCADAACLYTEIGADSVQLFSRDSNSGLAAYTGGGKGSGQNFTLNPGEGYFVKVSANTPYTPSHY